MVVTESLDSRGRLRKGLVGAVGVRLGCDARVIDRLVALGEQGMASGVDESLDIDAFVEAAQASD